VSLLVVFILALGDVVALRQLSDRSKKRQQLKLVASITIVWGIAIVCSPLQVMVSYTTFTGVKLFAFACVLLRSMVSSAGSLHTVLISLRVQMTHRGTNPNAKALATRSFKRLVAFTVSLHTLLLCAVGTQIYVGTLNIQSRITIFFTVDGTTVVVPDAFPPAVLVFAAITMLSVGVNLAFFWSVTPPTAPTQPQESAYVHAEYDEYADHSLCSSQARSFSDAASIYLISASFASDGRPGQHTSMTSDAPSSGASLPE
jgi:hypothetical protein